MPNWCSNTITISSDKSEKIKEFVDFLEEKNGKEWFSFFRSTPEELKENGWYEWNLENWGTKWNCDAQDWSIDQDFTEVRFWFDSAWSPPTELYKFITENTDFTVEAEYNEEGIGFVGQFVDGFDETYEYESLDDLDDIPEHLVENWNLRDNLESWEDDENEE